MNNNYSWFFDVFTAAILLFYLYTGGKRGFVKSILFIAGYLVSFVLAFFISGSASPVIYDDFIKPKVISTVEKELDQMDITSEIQRTLNNTFGKYGVSLKKEDVNKIISSDSSDIGTTLSKFINSNFRDANVDANAINDDIKNIFSSSVLDKFLPSMPGYMQGTVDNYISQSSNNMNETLKVLTGTKQEAASYIEEHMIRSNVLSIVKIIVFIVVFSLSLLIFKLLSRLMSFINKIPLVGPMNTFLGMIVGIIQGLLAIYIIALIIHVLIALSGGEMLVFNTKTIENTILFKRIYDFNILLL